VIVNVYQWAPEMTDVLDIISKKHMNFKLKGMQIQDTTRPLPTAAVPYSQFFDIVKA
jgi:hypothetical protein